MTRIEIERKEGDKWIRTGAELKTSRNGNPCFRLGERWFMLENMREGSPVLELKGGKWMKVGRKVWPGVFIGDGPTWREAQEKLDDGKSLGELLPWLNKGSGGKL